jgi:hypothetical protein
MRASLSSPEVQDAADMCRGAWCAGGCWPPRSPRGRSTLADCWPWGQPARAMRVLNRDDAGEPVPPRWRVIEMLTDETSFDINYTILSDGWILTQSP